MAKDFVKLSEVTKLETVEDTASVLVEVDGEIYRAPKTQVGGAGGTKTAIIRDSGYLNAIAGVSTMAAPPTPTYTFECINMTFEEAYETMANGEFLTVVGMFTSYEMPINVHGEAAFVGMTFGVECIGLLFNMYRTDGSIMGTVPLYWTTDGLSTDMPSDK